MKSTQIKSSILIREINVVRLRHDTERLNHELTSSRTETEAVLACERCGANLILQFNELSQLVITGDLLTGPCEPEKKEN